MAALASNRLFIQLSTSLLHHCIITIIYGHCISLTWCDNLFTFTLDVSRTWINFLNQCIWNAWLAVSNMTINLSEGEKTDNETSGALTKKKHKYCWSVIMKKAVTVSSRNHLPLQLNWQCSVWWQI